MAHNLTLNSTTRRKTCNEVVEGKCFWLQHDLRSWRKANSSCDKRGQGYRLASVDSYTESAVTGSVAGCNFAVWINLHEPYDNGKWQRADGLEITYTNWEENQPDDFGDGEDCAAIWYGSPKWNDYRCSQPIKYFCSVKLDAGESFDWEDATSFPCQEEPGAVDIGFLLYLLGAFLLGMGLVCVCCCCYCFYLRRTRSRRQAAPPVQAAQTIAVQGDIDSALVIGVPVSEPLGSEAKAC